MIDEKYLGGCYELEKISPELIEGGCCGSCHEDVDEYGYTPQYIETEKGFYEVCCKVNEAYRTINTQRETSERIIGDKP